MAVTATGYPRSGSYTCGGARSSMPTEPTARRRLTPSRERPLLVSWKTNKLWAATCRTFVLKLADGTYHYVDVFFDK